MAFSIIEHLLGAQPIAVTDTTQNHPLGTIVRAKDPTYGVGEFIYLKGVADTVVGSWVTYLIDDGATALLAANAIGPVAIAMSANVASQYGWYQINGAAIGKVTAAVDDNDALYSTSTAGSVEDTVVTGDRVWGVTAAAATTGAGSVLCNINRPFVNDGVNAGTS